MLNSRICLITVTVTYMLILHCGCRTEHKVIPVPVPKPPIAPPEVIKPPVKQPLKPKPPPAPTLRQKKPAAIVKPPPLKESKKTNVSHVKLPESVSSRFLSADNFVTRWTVCGPFKFKEIINEQSPPESIIHHAFVENEKNINDQTKKCQSLLPDLKAEQQFLGRVNLAKIYPGVEYAAAYAIAYLDSDKTVSNLKLYSGSGGYIKIWLNGQLIHTFNRHNRDSRWDQDIVNGIKLKKGRNQVVVKSITITKPWSFYFRLTDKNGLPLTFSPEK
jgi:hypothetical protein